MVARSNVGRRLQRLSLHEEDTMPGAGDGQGRRETRGPGAEHCHAKGLHASGSRPVATTKRETML